MAVRAQAQSFTLKGSTEIVAEFFSKLVGSQMISNTLPTNRRGSLTGKAPDCRAEGRGFDPQFMPSRLD